MNQHSRCMVISPRWSCSTMPCDAEMNALAAMYKSNGYAYITTFRYLNAPYHNNQVMLIPKRNLSSDASYPPLFWFGAKDTCFCGEAAPG